MGASDTVVGTPASCSTRSVSKRLLGGDANGSISRASSSLAKGMLTATRASASRASRPSRCASRRTSLLLVMM
jgi:hypothetical protein